MSEHSRASSRIGDEYALSKSCPTVDAKILDDLYEIGKLSEMLSAQGASLMCDHCGDEEESVAAIVTLVHEPMERFSLCGLCYRELCELALGEVS